jgi:hypothetical protein
MFFKQWDPEIHSSCNTLIYHMHRDLDSHSSCDTLISILFRLFNTLEVHRMDHDLLLNSHNFALFSCVFKFTGPEVSSIVLGEVLFSPNFLQRDVIFSRTFPDDLGFYPWNIRRNQDLESCEHNWTVQNCDYLIINRDPSDGLLTCWINGTIY